MGMGRKVRKKVGGRACHICAPWNKNPDIDLETPNKKHLKFFAEDEFSQFKSFWNFISKREKQNVSILKTDSEIYKHDSGK